MKWPKSLPSLECRCTEKDYEWRSVSSLRRVNEKGLQYTTGVESKYSKAQTSWLYFSSNAQWICYTGLHVPLMSLYELDWTGFILYNIFQCLHWAFPNELHLSRAVSKRGPRANLRGGGGGRWAQLWPTGEIWDDRMWKEAGKWFTESSEVPHSHANQLAKQDTVS